MFTQNYGRLQNRADSRPAVWAYGARAQFMEVLDIMGARRELRNFYILMLSFDDLTVSSCNYKMRRAFVPRAQKRRGGPKPYGYDSFMATKKRESADAFWLKNTVYQKSEEDND